MIHKTLQRKLKIDQRKLQLKIIASNCFDDCFGQFKASRLTINICFFIILKAIQVKCV